MKKVRFTRECTSMRLIITLVIIAAIALIGSLFTFNRKKIPLGTRHILLTGIEYIFIGFILGPEILNILDRQTINDLHPFLSFGLGWIGFLFGLQFDFNKIKLPLLVRFRKAGDRFLPLGMDREKKIGKFLTAARLPLEHRQKLLIIADREKIIWLWPIRLSQQTKINGDTRKILQLKITNITTQTG